MRRNVWHVVVHFSFISLIILRDFAHNTFTFLGISGTFLLLLVFTFLKLYALVPYLIVGFLVFIVRFTFSLFLVQQAEKENEI